jgi:hypothetical protein
MRECVLEEIQEAPLLGRCVAGECDVSIHQSLKLQAMAMRVDAFLLQVHARTSVSSC